MRCGRFGEGVVVRDVVRAVRRVVNVLVVVDGVGRAGAVRKSMWKIRDFWEVG